MPLRKRGDLMSSINDSKFSKLPSHRPANSEVCLGPRGGSGDDETAVSAIGVAFLLRDVPAYPNASRYSSRIDCAFLLFRAGLSLIPFVTVPLLAVRFAQSCPSIHACLLGSDIPQCQPNEFRRRVIIRKMAARLDDCFGVARARFRVNWSCRSGAELPGGTRRTE